jgi:hypothetical protein
LIVIHYKNFIHEVRPHPIWQDECQVSSGFVIN